MKEIFFLLRNMYSILHNTKQAEIVIQNEFLPVQIDIFDRSFFYFFFNCIWKLQLFTVIMALTI